MAAFVFANQKGGVGKTTVTLGIAAELARPVRRVLLIERDAQASATKVVGIDLYGGVVDGRRDARARSLRATHAISMTGGFDLAPSETALASRESRRSTADEFVLRRQLAMCRGYDVVLIDCPPSLGVLTLNALAAASHLVVGREDVRPVAIRESRGLHSLPSAMCAWVLLRGRRLTRRRETGVRASRGFFWGPSSAFAPLHACRPAYVHERLEADMETYVFANQKGGVGKTTITLGVGAALARRGARVLLIDLDPQASATKVLGIDTDERCTVADALLEPSRYSLADTTAATDWGFDIAPAEMALASREARRSAADEFVLRDQLEGVAGYDVVLVDSPPSLGVLTLNALAAASHLVLVTEPSFLALQGIEELLETRDLVCAHYNARLVLAGVIVNRVERTVEHRAGLREIAGFFGPDLMWSPALPKRTVLQEGARRGVPLGELRGRAARELDQDFAELAGRIGVSCAV